MNSLRFDTHLNFFFLFVSDEAVTLSVGAILGISIPLGILFIVIVILLIMFCCCPQLLCCYAMGRKRGESGQGYI